MGIFRATFLTALGVILLGTLFPAALCAEDSTRVKATNQEILDEVSTFVDLPKDTLQLVFNESPGLLDNLGETITALKIVDMFSEAKDTEALTEIYNWQTGKIIDKLKDKLLPGPLLTLITAVKVYETSLELIRDHCFIPAMEANIYVSYKSARGGIQDYRYASPDEAYDQATASGSYFPAKQKMYDEMIKAKGYNSELIGEKTEKYLWGKIDAFWKNRLEAQYQLELIKKSRSELIAAIWNKSRSDIERLRRAAALLQQPQKKPADPPRKTAPQRPTPKPAATAPTKPPAPAVPAKTHAVPATSGTTSAESKPAAAPAPKADPNRCYAPIGAKIAKLRSQNQAQNWQSGNVTTQILGNDHLCVQQYQQCIENAKQVANNCRPNARGTYDECISAEAKAWVDCSQKELSCEEPKARAACGF